MHSSPDNIYIQSGSRAAKVLKPRLDILQDGADMRDYNSIYNEWINNEFFDDETKAELLSIKGDEHEIRERFFMDLEFGTAGLRGVIGAGTNRMNKYVVRRASQGLANYILKQGGADKGVAIAFDSRHMSPEFADETARCLAANGIKAYIFDALRPTPELSFAVRKLGCIAGVNITASHNPAKYNGYKVYWEDGAQFTPPHDKAVMESVLSISDYSKCLTMQKDEAVKQGLYISIGREIDDAYIEEIKKTIIDKEALSKGADQISIVYTPLNGTGHVPVRRILSELGFTKVYEVKEQADPDGDFPTVQYPNPESKEAFKLALELAEEKKADIVLATDPDADRLGVYVKDKNGEYHALTGNMSGSLLCEYVLSRKKELGLIPDDAFTVESIVSTDMIKAVSAYYGVSTIEVLTGFKWIGREILKSETEGRGHYMFGMEESYGCLIGTYARDKDAVSAATSLCEAAAFYKLKGKTLYDVLNEMYDRYGYYYESLDTVTLEGVEGLNRINSIMNTIREAVPKNLGSYEVIAVRDYKKGTVTEIKTGESHDTGLPNSDAVYFELDDNAWVCVRPSGTEPKLKIYAGVKGRSALEAEKLSSMLHSEIRERFIDTV